MTSENKHQPLAPELYSEQSLLDKSNSHPDSLLCELDADSLETQDSPLDTELYESDLHDTQTVHPTNDAEQLLDQQPHVDAITRTESENTDTEEHGHLPNKYPETTDTDDRPSIEDKLDGYRNNSQDQVSSNDPASTGIGDGESYDITHGERAPATDDTPGFYVEAIDLDARIERLDTTPSGVPYFFNPDTGDYLTTESENERSTPSDLERRKQEVAERQRTLERAPSTANRLGDSLRGPDDTTLGPEGTIVVTVVAVWETAKKLKKWTRE